MSHVVKVIRETVDALAASPAVSFGHGEESYQNLQGDPGDPLVGADVAWLHPFLVIDAFAKNALLYQTYRITMHFGTQSNLNNSPAQLEQFLVDMFNTTSEFLIRLDKDTRVQPRLVTDNSGVLNIRRAPLYHTQDINVTGYAIEFDLTLDIEAFDYCVIAPATIDVTTLTCLQLADLTDGQHACIIEFIADATLVANVTASQQAALIAAFCVLANVRNSDSTYTDTVAGGDTLVLPDIVHTDSDASAVILPAQTPMVCTPCINEIQIFADFPDGNDDEINIAIVGGVNDGTFDLDAATLTNVASVVYKKNAGVVSGVTAFAGGDTLTIEITRTIAADASVELDGTFV